MQIKNINQTHINILESLIKNERDIVDKMRMAVRDFIKQNMDKHILFIDSGLGDVVIPRRHAGDYDYVIAVNSMDELFRLKQSMNRYQKKSSSSRMAAMLTELGKLPNLQVVL